MLAEIAFFISLVVLVEAGFQITARYRAPAILVALFVPYLLYLSMAIPGFLGMLEPVPVLSCFAVLGLLWTRIAWGGNACGSAGESGAGRHARPNRFGAMLALPLAAAGVLMAFLPISSAVIIPPGNPPPPPVSLAEAVWRWLERMTGFIPYAFDWDTTSYHLPGLMEFLQNGTLWSFRGPFQSYSYGFELITGFSVMAGGVLTVVAGNMLGLVIAVAAGMLAVRAIGATLASRRLGWPYEMSLTLVFAGLTMTAIGGALNQLGKNDVFTASCLLAALALLIDALVMTGPGEDASRTGARQVLAILGSATALALAMASKPNSLAYFPLWAASLGVVLWKRPIPSRRHLGALLAGVAVVLALGLLFTVRNVAVFGRLSGDLGFTTWDKTMLSAVVGGFIRTVMTAVDYRMLAILGGFTAILAAPLLMLRGLHRLAMAMAGAWFLYGLAIFTVTPFSLHQMTLIQWRLGASSFLIAMVGLAVLIDRLFAAAALMARHTVPAAGPAPAVAARAIRLGRCWPVAAAAAVTVIVLLHHGKGVPRPQQTTPLYHGEVYDWVAAQPPSRIYATGLRPYGLFGAKLKHQLFYDLMSTELYDEDHVEKRLNRVRREFAPDLIIIATDRSMPGPNAQKPAVPWLLRQPCLTEVFSTADVSAFRVEPGCTAPWGNGTEEDGPLKMRIRS